MRVFRIEREKYLESTLKGIGAALTEGFRWNSLHTSLVYTSESRALATLEIAVHLDLSEDVPTDRYYVEIDIPDSVEILELRYEDLPRGWDAKPPSLESQYIGDDFVLENSAAVLKVPSSIVPLAYNYLINPQHPDARKISVVEKIPLVFDQRIKQSKRRG
jgi:RES domain-containing protein